MLEVSLKFKPDLFLSNGSMFAALSAFLLRKRHIVHEDTGNWEQMVFYLPFSRYILTPESLKQDFGKKQYRYKGFQESFYLHRDHFKADPSVLVKYGLNGTEQYLVLRFVRYNASHDMGYKTLTPKQIEDLVSQLAGKYSLFVSYEGGVTDNLIRYCRQFEPQDVHHMMAFSKGYIGQSATMASEAAHLHIPSIFIKSLNEITEGVIDYQNEKGYIRTLDYSEHQVQDILDAFFEIKDKELPDVQDYICDPTDLLYKVIINPNQYWRTRQ
jgi:predicted glycosyltransferase